MRLAEHLAVRLVGRPAAAPCGDVVGVHLGLPVDALLEIRLARRRAHRAVRDACGLRRVERLQGFGNSYLMAAHMRPIGPKPANAGVSWPYGGVRVPVTGSKPPMSNCVPPHGKREGVLCLRLVEDRPPKRATGSPITPARSSRVLESLRRDVLGKQVASPRIADFLFTCQNPTSSLHEHLLEQALLQFLPLRQLVLRLLDDLIHRSEAVGDFALLGEGGNLHDVIQYHVWNNTLLTI